MTKDDTLVSGNPADVAEYQRMSGEAVEESLGVPEPPTLYPCETCGAGLNQPCASWCPEMDFEDYP